jgi:hypothetical protein
MTKTNALRQNIVKKGLISKKLKRVRVADGVA